MSSKGSSAPLRKGANGVLLKKFEATLQQMFSACSSSTSSPQALDALTPRYSVQPPRLSDTKIEQLVECARDFWREGGLISEQSDAECCAGENNDTMSPPWPFDKHTSLPSCGHVRQPQDTNNVQPKARTTKTKTGKDKGGQGDIMSNERAWRKELQLANLIHCVLALLPEEQLTPKYFDEGTNPPIRIVDFAGGTGHLAVPLALLLPHCEVVCVDFKKWSLDLLHRRVDGCYHEATDLNVSKRMKAIPNLSTYYGSIQSWADSFDIGVSLHACGEASDWVLRKCLQQNTSFVICSCCCGKLSKDAKDPYVYHSTGGNDKKIHYPQSRMFASLGQSPLANNNYDQQMTPDMFDELAKAADYSEVGDLRKPGNSCRRAAKSLVEWDRILFAKECWKRKEVTSHSNGGNVILTRMLPWDASTKNDIIMGWSDGRAKPYPSTNIPVDESCDNDFQTALHHLFETAGDRTQVHFIETNECAND